MMMFFWLLLALLLLFSLLFVVYPYLCKDQKEFVTTDNQNIALYQRQFAELQHEFEHGKLTQAQYQEAYDELQANLLEDVSEKKNSNSSQNTTYSSKSMIALMIFVPIVTLLFYSKWGSSEQLVQWYQSQEQVEEITALAQELDTPEKVINKLKEGIAVQPDNPRGWFLLGHMQARFNQFDEAETSLAKAYELDPQSTETMLRYAEILFINNGRRLSEQARELLLQVIALEEENLAALNFLALGEYQAGNYRQAIMLWRQVLPKLDPRGADAAAIEKAIIEAQGKL